MSGWRKLKQRMFDLDTFYPLEDLRLCVWILVITTYEGGIQVGCMVLGEMQYIPSIWKFREILWFYNRKKIDESSHSRIQHLINRLEWEKYKYAYVFMFWATKDFACGDYLNRIGISVKRGQGHDSGLSSYGEEDVNRVR
jgi:hypothetical protein